ADLCNSISPPILLKLIRASLMPRSEDINGRDIYVGQRMIVIIIYDDSSTTFSDAIYNAISGTINKGAPS
ncbi:1246_t:CDS:2, partial [Racocetra persica]